MGQHASATRKGGGRSKASSSPTQSGGAVELRDLSTFLGKCWLLAESQQSFSPSRWFPLCDRTLAKCPPMCRRQSCFALASLAPMPEKQRAKDPGLRAVPRLSVPPGLQLTVYTKASIRAYPMEELAERPSIRVEGVHVDLTRLHNTLRSRTAPEDAKPKDKDGGLPLARPPPYVCVCVLWRMDIEMDPTKYASAPFRRHPIRYPVTTAEDRAVYGDGCITGVRYGGLLLGVSDDETFARVFEDAVKADRAFQNADWSGTNDHHSTTSKSTGLLQVVDVKGGGDEVSGVVDRTVTVKDCAAWAASVYPNPRLWAPLSLFLQRYEAIGQCLLVS